MIFFTIRDKNQQEHKKSTELSNHFIRMLMNENVCGEIRSAC